MLKLNYCSGYQFKVEHSKKKKKMAYGKSVQIFRIKNAI